MKVARQITIRSEGEMTAFGAALARILTPGTALLLSGPIGAGKTHLARAIIQSLLPEAKEVPSPTYTLVQTYTGDVGEIWHADLYRLSDSSELVELGLDDAFQSAIVIIEWPDRLPLDMKPSETIEIGIAPDADARTLDVSGADAKLSVLLDVIPHV